MYVVFQTRNFLVTSTAPLNSNLISPNNISSTLRSNCHIYLRFIFGSWFYKLVTNADYSLVRDRSLERATEGSDIYRVCEQG